MFLDCVDEYYQSPHLAKQGFFCHFYLVLAIGSILAAPNPGGRQELVIKKQLSKIFDQAELFFLSAKALRDPVGVALEGADIWSIQSLCLMSLYMLAVSRRNAAYEHIGWSNYHVCPVGLDPLSCSAC